MFKVLIVLLIKILEVVFVEEFFFCGVGGKFCSIFFSSSGDVIGFYLSGMDLFDNYMDDYCLLGKYFY